MARVAKARYTPIARTDASEKLQAILATSMAKDPAQRHESMYALAEELRWAQYDLGIPPTALEVASPDWAAATSVNFSDASARGPVITTVDKNSRRAARSQNVVARLNAADDGVTADARPGVSTRAVAIGVIVALAAVGLAVLLIRMLGA